MGRSPVGRLFLLLAASLAAAQPPSGTAAAAAAAAGVAAGTGKAVDLKKHHHHHHHHHHHKGHHHRHNKTQSEKRAEVAQHVQLKVSEQANATHAFNASQASQEPTNNTTKASQEPANTTTKAPETPTTTKAPESAKSQQTDKGTLQVNAPLPPDFSELFAESVAAATGCAASHVHVLGSEEADGEEGKLARVQFEAPKSVVEAVLDQAADAESKLATGPLCRFLVASVEGGDIAQQCKGEGRPDKKSAALREEEQAEEGPSAPSAPPATGGVDATGIDVDTAMPYGDLEPFGREDTAQELTESSIKESNAMVDQLERAEVAEEKRAVFRALTRLRGAAITSFDGIARAQTSVMDEYNKLHQWRSAHPLRHLADEESDISKWAFPDANF